MLCNLPIKTYDNTIKTCIRIQGHPGGCNPFSDTCYAHEKPIEECKILETEVEKDGRGNSHDSRSTSTGSD